MSDESVFSFSLPEDVFSEILLRLPIKSILACTCVSKTWNSFITRSSFVNSHLNRTISSYKETGTLLYLVQLCSLPEKTGIDTFSLHSDDEVLREYSPLYFPYKHMYGFQVICSCNGLVLLICGKLDIMSEPFSLILWNPVIRKSMVIVKRKNFNPLEAAGLGFDSKSGDYKVVTLMEELGNDITLKVELFSLKTNSWKRLPNVEGTFIRYFQVNREMVPLNGALHFVAFREFGNPRYLILGFDLEAEAFREIQLPDCMSDDWRSGGLCLWSCGESLLVSRKCEKNAKEAFVSDEYHYQIWMMKEYGVKESWTVVSTMSHLFPGRCSGLVHRKDGNVLLSVGSFKDSASRIVSHDLKRHKTEFLGYFAAKPNCYFFNSYVESLVLLDKGNELSTVLDIESWNPNDARFNSSSGDAARKSDDESISNTALWSRIGHEYIDSGDDEVSADSGGEDECSDGDSSEEDANEDSSSDEAGNDACLEDARD